MFRRAALLLSLLCLVPGMGAAMAQGTAPVARSAVAGNGLEALRSDVTTAREHVNGLREKQLSLRTELNGLSTRIEAMKARAGKQWVVGKELNAALVRSQDISVELGKLSRELTAAEDDKSKKQVALGHALASEVTTLQDRIAASKDRSERQRLAETVGKLRLERESLNAALPTELKLRALAVGNAASEDVTDLREQADTLRDNEDKLRKQMKLLEGRIKEVKRERDLDRRMSEFMGDEALFDESDRRLRFSSRAAAAATASGDSANGAPVASQESAPQSGASGGTADTSGGTGTEQGFNGPSHSPAPMDSPPPAPPPAAPPAPAPAPVPNRTSEPARTGAERDSRPRIGQMADPRLETHGRNLKNLESQLEEMRRAAEAYRKKADALENKARTLDAP